LILDSALLRLDEARFRVNNGFPHFRIITRSKNVSTRILAMILGALPVLQAHCEFFSLPSIDINKIEVEFTINCFQVLESEVHVTNELLHRGLTEIFFKVD